MLFSRLSRFGFDSQCSTILKKKGYPPIESAVFVSSRKNEIYTWVHEGKVSDFKEE